MTFKRTSILIAASMLLLGGCSGLPTTGAGANGSANGQANTGVTSGDLASLYTLGRTWVYSVTTGQAPSTSYTDVVTAVANNKATITRTTQVANVAAPVINTYTADLTAKDPLAANASSDANAQYSYDMTAPSAESVTVAAGTFNALHVKGTVKTTQTAANSNTSVDTWYSASVGLIKIKSSTTLNLSASLPAGITLPAGVTIPGTTAGGAITSTIELTSFK
jgi:hypothetical protein